MAARAWYVEVQRFLVTLWAHASRVRIPVDTMTTSIRQMALPEIREMSLLLKEK
jgi:hypothetical protein